PLAEIDGFMFGGEPRHDLENGGAEGSEKRIGWHGTPEFFAYKIGRAAQEMSVLFQYICHADNNSTFRWLFCDILAIPLCAPAVLNPSKVIPLTEECCRK